MRGTPHEVAVVFRRKARALERAVREAEAASAREALALARGLSTGGLDQRDLRHRGHPYRVGGPGPALPINLQSGRFYSAWRLTGPRKVAGGLQATVRNDAPHARFLDRGTRRMMARPIGARVRARTAAARARRHRAALKAIHTGG